jgi:capsule polysaccharide export protein KpsE/RkpR
LAAREGALSAGPKQVRSLPEGAGAPDLAVKAKSAELAPLPADELLIEAVDEQTLLRARERNAARVRLLWSRRRFLFRSAIAGLAIATALAFVIPTRFTASTQLMPPDTGTGSNLMSSMLASRVGGGLANLAQSALGMQTTGAMFMGILKSDTVLDDLISKFGLQKLYGVTYLADARRVLTDHTGISEDEKSGIITISVVDHDPRRAAAMAQEYVNELNWVVSNLSTSSAHRERVFLDSRLEQVKTDLETAEKQFSQFASQRGAIDIPEQGKAMVTAAATLQGQLIGAEAELEGLQQIYTSSNVRVRMAQAQVSRLRDSLEKLAGQGTTENSRAQELYPSLRELPLLGVNYADLLRRTKVEEAVFETLTQEDELAKVEEAKEIPSVRVLDPPEVPQKKSFPPRMTFMVLGTLAGIVIGTAWVLTNSAWQAIDPSDPRKAVATEVWTDVRALMPWNGRNGSLNGGSKNGISESIVREQELGAAQQEKTDDSSATR